MLQTRNRTIIHAIILINLLGTVLGFAYYKDQLLETPVRLWPFVPDCPNYTLLFAISLFFLLQDKRHDLYNFIASIGIMKYGFWTLFVTLLYSDYFLSPGNKLFYLVLFLLHFGMLVEAVLIFHKIKVRGIFIPLALSWFFLNDLFDYSLTFSTHPWLPYSAPPFSTISKATLLMSLVFTLLVYFMCKKTQKHILIDF